jgi:hypothetical protein
MKKFLKKILKIISSTLAYKKYLVLGDSHAMVFNHPLFKLYFPFKYFDVNVVHGATISGIENPNSKTNAHNIFNERLENSTSKNNKIILLLGEVDTGFVIWYKAEKENLDVQIILNETLNKYKNFILKCTKYAPTFVISSPLPTITDDNDWGEVANLRKEIKATQIQKTKLTLEFNSKIKKFCINIGVEYLDLDRYSINNEGFVKSFLLSKNNLDHHYDKKNYAKLIIRNAKNIL